MFVHGSTTVCAFRRLIWSEFSPTPLTERPSSEAFTSASFRRTKKHKPLGSTAATAGRCAAAGVFTCRGRNRGWSNDACVCQSNVYYICDRLWSIYCVLLCHIIYYDRYIMIDILSIYILCLFVWFNTCVLLCLFYVFFSDWSGYSPPLLARPYFS